METELFAMLSPIVSQFFYILLGFFGMGFLIAFHELGHFLGAKLFNVRTPSFSIGFGPKICSKKIGQTEFSLSAIPFGGYVEMAGAAEIGQGDQKEAHATDEGSFSAKPFYQKFCIMLGGIFFNLIFAYVTMIILFMTGIPKTKFMYQTNGVPVIASIQPDSAAEKYGLQIGDRIIAIQGQPIGNDILHAQELLQPLANTQADFEIERNGHTLVQNITVGSKEVCSTTIGALGVEWDMQPTPPHSFTSAIVQGIAMTNRWIKNTFAGFSSLFSKKGIQSVAGPIGIIAMTVNGAAQGFKILLLLLVLISINLAVLNLIPLPILDGGQILFYFIEALLGRPMPERIREYIHIATWLLFIILFVYLSAQDIYCIAKPYINKIFMFLGSQQ